MASGKLYKRGEKWYLDIHTGRKVNGKYERIQRKAVGRTKAEAQAELDELLFTFRRAQRDNVAFDNAYPIQSVCDAWCDHIRRIGGNTNLVNGYCIQAQRMVDALDIEAVTELTPEKAEEAIRKIADKYSTNTANKSLAKMKAALDYAKENGVIVSNPITKAKGLRTIRKKFRRELEHDEVEALLRTAPVPWRTTWYFMLSTGVRRNELLYLKWPELDLKKGRVRIVEQDDFKPKTEAGARTIPLNEKMVKSLGELPKDCEFVFSQNGKQIRPETLLDVFRKHVEYALRNIAREKLKTNKPMPRGVTYDSTADEFQIDTNQLDLHSLRYTFITELIGAGVDPKTVQHLAGHKSIETTLAIYAQVKAVNAEDAIKQLPW